MLTCGIQWACWAGESGRVWLFDRDFQIFFENTCPTFVDDFDFCILNVVLPLLAFASPPSSLFAELLLPEKSDEKNKRIVIPFFIFLLFASLQIEGKQSEFKTVHLATSQSAKSND